MQIAQKKLSINCLSDDMIKCATEFGYKIPCVSIKHHYGKAAHFITYYKNGQESSYELNVLGKNNRPEAIYLM